MVFKNLCSSLHWAKVALALEGLRLMPFHFHRIENVPLCMPGLLGILVVNECYSGKKVVGIEICDSS